LARARGIHAVTEAGAYVLLRMHWQNIRLHDAQGQPLNLNPTLKRAGDSPAHRRVRAKLRSPAGQARYRRRQELVEPVFGVLKEQRGMRRFRRRG
jgi:hypothetical protein